MADSGDGACSRKFREMLFYRPHRKNGTTSSRGRDASGHAELRDLWLSLSLKLKFCHFVFSVLPFTHVLSYISFHLRSLLEACDWLGSLLHHGVTLLPF